MRHPVAALAAVACLAAGGLAGCGRGTQHPQLPASADASQGRHWIEYYGCGACHVIPGIATADGHVGPPLADFASRYHQIVGKLPNTPANVVRWVTNPRKYLPNGDMPDLGLSTQQARDVAAYLYEH